MRIYDGWKLEWSVWDLGNRLDKITPNELCLPTLKIKDWLFKKDRYSPYFVSNKPHLKPMLQTTLPPNHLQQFSRNLLQKKSSQTENNPRQESGSGSKRNFIQTKNLPKTGVPSPQRWWGGYGYRQRSLAGIIGAKFNDKGALKFSWEFVLNTNKAKLLAVKQALYIFGFVIG